jgi:hypothetical protein
VFSYEFFYFTTGSSQLVLFSDFNKDNESLSFELIKFTLISCVVFDISAASDSDDISVISDGQC